MSLIELLLPSDAGRAQRTLEKLSRRGIGSWALTGGLAIEFQIAHRGGEAAARLLNDIDFVVDSFSRIPHTLHRDFLFRHVHPGDPPGKTLLQMADPETSVRVDVFRAYGNEMTRSRDAEICGDVRSIISFGDLVARHARLCWDLTLGREVAPKIARDLLRMAPLPVSNEANSVWIEHRTSEMPSSFVDAIAALRIAMESRPELLAARTYSTDVNEACVRCVNTDHFPLADARQILTLLGYC